MKLCFLLNNAPGMVELFSLLNAVAKQKGLETCAISNSRLVDIKYKNRFTGCNYYSTLDSHSLQEDISLPKDLWGKWYPSIDRKCLFGPLRLDYRESIEIVTRIYKSTYKFLTKEKPDIIIYEPPSNVFSLTVFSICQELDIEYFGLIGSRIPGKFDIFDSCFTSRLLKNNLDMDMREKNIPEIINGIVTHSLLPSYIIESPERRSIVSYYGKRLKEECGALSKWYLLKDKSRDYEAKFIIKNIPRNVFKSIISRYAFKRKLEMDIPTEPYYVLPLHVQPESSTSAQATYYSDLDTFVKNCAMSLPFPCKLVVKEHPQFAKLRKTSFYNKIRKLPNVVILGANVNNSELIRRSKGVITLTSTMGFESLLLKKPVYLFGEVFFQHHPAAIKINNWDDLHMHLRQGNYLTDKEWDKKNMQFIGNYLNINYAGSFVYTNKNCRTINNAEKIINAIYDHFKKVSSI
ncbi:capsular polysaccharide export protein, LipB/KpsS family [Syntrophomonas erecta]